MILKGGGKAVWRYNRKLGVGVGVGGGGRGRGRGRGGGRGGVRGLRKSHLRNLGNVLQGESFQEQAVRSSGRQAGRVGCKGSKSKQGHQRHRGHWHTPRAARTQQGAQRKGRGGRGMGRETRRDETRQDKPDGQNLGGT